MSSRVGGRSDFWIGNDHRQLAELQRQSDLARHAEMEAIPQPGDGDWVRSGMILIVVLGLLVNLGLFLLVRFLIAHFA